MMEGVEDKTVSASERPDINIERDLKAFTGLLDLAEEVHARRENIRKQFFLAMGGGAAGILGAAAAMASFSRVIDFDGEYLSAPEFFTSPLALVLSTVIIVAYVGVMFLYIQYRKQMRRETRALEEVMSVIHEVLQSSEMHMSPLEIAQVKIRLSRMDN